MWSDARPPTATQVRDAFGVGVGELRPHLGGFEADAFTDGRWFVKLWRQRPDSDAALALTTKLAARGVPVPAAHRGTTPTRSRGRCAPCTRSPTLSYPAPTYTSGASRSCATGATTHGSASAATRSWPTSTGSKR